MAMSFNACGRSRCPTCRGPVRVDFDSESGRLSFAKDDEDVEDDQALAEHKAEAAKRLLEQARPAQIRALARYGATRPVLAAIRTSPAEALGALSPEDLRRHLFALGDKFAYVEAEALKPEHLVEAAGGAERLAAYWAEKGEEGAKMPSCVCGSNLRRIEGSVRYFEFAQTLLPGYPDDHPLVKSVTDQLLEAGAVQCDLCVKAVDPSSGVWTCETDSLTILHATSYDVCDLCLARHAGAPHPLAEVAPG